MARLQKKEENRKWKLGRQVSIFALTVNNLQKCKSRNLAAEFPFSTFGLFCVAGSPFSCKWEKFGRVSKMCLFNPLQSTTTHFYISTQSSASPCARTCRPLERMATVLKKDCVFPQVCVHSAWRCGITVMCPQVVQPLVDGCQIMCMTYVCSMHWCPFCWTLCCLHVVGIITNFRHSWWLRLSLFAKLRLSQWLAQKRFLLLL